MNIQVLHGATDITDEVLKYNRSHHICSGIGTLELHVLKGRNYDTWDKIILYEHGYKKGEYYIGAYDEDVMGSIQLSCQDNSKRMQDYFLDEPYQVANTTASRYWIKKFLNAAGVNFKFQISGDGEPIAPNTTFGMATCYDEVMRLLQLNGWFFYVNQNGKVIIGDINRNIEDYNHDIDDTDIITIGIHKDDTRLRNRVVVWGNTDPITGVSIYVDISTATPWNYDSRDKRTVVMANSMIRDHAIALEYAYKLLNEFSNILYTKMIKIHSSNSIRIGDSMLVESRGYNGVGLVTTVGSELSPSDGLTTNIVLDERCPRLFAYFNYWGTGVPIWVYIGTKGAGIWKRLTNSATWTDNSSGLGTDLNIKDLFIKDGNFVCVTMSGGVYTRSVATDYWAKYQHPDLMDSRGKIYSAGVISGVACSINDLGHIIVGYNYIPSGIIVSSGDRAWVLELTHWHHLVKAEQVIVGSGTAQSIFDIEALPEYNIISTAGGEIPSGVNPEFPPIFEGLF